MQGGDGRVYILFMFPLEYAFLCEYVFIVLCSLCVADATGDVQIFRIGLRFG